MNNKSEDTIFALRPGTIEIDDIVLTSHSGITPFAIRTFTQSHISHAALCTMPDMLFEAVRDGVMRRSVIGTFAHRSEWIRVLRPRNPLPRNADGLRVADYADALYGRGYSRQGAVASRFPILGGVDDGAVFCSQSIAQAYLQYGVTLVPGKTPSQVYPAMLLTSPELTDVTGRCIRELGSVSNTALYRLVFDTANQEAPGAEMRMNRQAFEAIQNELGSSLPGSVHSLTELSIWLSNESSSNAVRQADAPVLDVLERKGIFKWYEDFSADARAMAAILELAATAAELSTGTRMDPETQALLNDLQEAIPLAEASLARRESTAQDYKNLATTTGLKTFERFASAYKKQHEDALRIHSARTRLMDALRRRSA